MQLQFEHQAYQHHAINAVVQLFCGQANRTQEFELMAGGNTPVVANHLTLPVDEISKNLNSVQRTNHQPQTQICEHGLNFSIEMETGTGKTYVYLRTIFELHKQYGWTKFVIVVPSVAIREGVLQSIRAMKTHFDTEFDKPVFNHTVYHSSKLTALKQFATSQHIEILIMNIDAFKKDDNVINRINESGEAPMTQISQTRPIVMVDEPQNMETDLAKQAIDSLNPLFVLRYSATHKNPYHKIYSLNPIEAYNQKLVKQIEVNSVLSKNDTNGAYVVLKEFVAGKKSLQAKVELHYHDNKETKKKTVSVKSGDDLFDKSNGNESYRHGFIVNGLDMENGTMALSGGQIISRDDDNDLLRDEIMKAQMQCTIKEHLAKEKRLNPQGIKVLSLFFIDKVANYRSDGKFAKWFVEIYERETGESAVGVHDGYFSGDKDTKGNSAADEATYDLIMKDKEKLLSFNSPLRFIFSHSALKEGWDNPNVFQICTLNETRSPIKKRQEIGRGLRLAVNQQGMRVRDEAVNILTVIPNESYESFAANLQKEYTDECGIHFANGGVKNADSKKSQTFRKGFTLDPEFLEIWQKLQHKTCYSVQFERQALIRQACESIAQMPTIQKPQIEIKKATIQQNQTDGIFGKEKASHYQDVQINGKLPNILQDIQRKTQLTRQTVYEIIIKSNRLNELQHNPQRFIDLVSEKILLALHELMVDGIEYSKLPENSESYRQSLAKWQDLEKNGTQFFLNEHTFYVKNSQKTIFADFIALDSHTEKQFAEDCENYDNVKLYFKLPSWFKIPTPIGSYNPDWAIVMQDCEQVYFVAETKNTGKGIQDGVDLSQLSQAEQQKIACAQRHFAVFDGIKYRVVQRVDEL
ncbi:restriction endonuclease [Testudinibacter sp. TR-2022]|uniref:restriction endonuclease n=1 Tax=Testudinibacter sp. TR-2022 TaxID=2585029 RepID=UPI0011199AB2|nr:DEAD/DEAH box helicase family protein [Testudinibacter sp. TR-2022]TNH09228.1 DEAD/DEAH box helicase [Pasteurellaceae bacterium Phil11]TNH25783.1 DEAD/DEAH box helicase [Testudinibacter sp. TR-2022]TNH28586.1 DEAD/DEAH box helicase [Testudinibacter sp. TR-2022]